MGTKSELEKIDVELAATVSGKVIKIVVHPAAEVWPLGSEEDRKDLAADIAAHGLQVPLVYRWLDRETIELLDGRRRRKAFELNGQSILLDDGTPNSAIMREVSSDADVEAIIESHNGKRRHLDRKQLRKVAAAKIKADPTKSNRQIAKEIDVDHKTIAAVRETVSSNGEIPHNTERKEASGRTARGVKPTPASAAKKSAGPDCYANKLVKLYAASGELFSVADAATKLRVAKSYVATDLLPKLQGNPVSGHVAWRKANSENAAESDRVWKIIPAEGVKDEPNEKPVRAVAAQAAELGAPPAASAFTAAPGGGVARAKRELQNLLRDDDLARRFIGILAEIAHGNADFEAILRAGAYMINELGVSESTAEQVIAAYDGLPQPAETIQ